jgi:hypothetical protein
VDTDAHGEYAEYDEYRKRKARAADAPIVASAVQDCLARRWTIPPPVRPNDPTCDLTIDTPCGPDHYRMVASGLPLGQRDRRWTTGDIADVVQPGRRTMELFRRLLAEVEDRDTQPIDVAAVRARLRA